MSSSSQHGPPDEATIAAYLSNRLDSSRAETFEAYCLSHPDFGRRVEADLFLKVGLRQLREPAKVQLTRPTPRRLLAIAASLTLVVGCGLLLFYRGQRTALTAYRSASEVPSVFLAGPRLSITLLRLREGSAVHRVIAPPQAKVLAVRIAPDAPPGALGYQVAVTVGPGITSRSVTLDALQADANGYIEMYLPLASLVGQTLKVTVTPSPAEGAEPRSFRLQVAAPDTTPGAAP